MAAKIKGLQQWCQKMAEGYPHVEIKNFTTSWRDGMAFCAIIHRFRPDLIDYDSLSPENVYENNKLAFEVGESELSIPAFLEAEDMARLKVPDKLSVITYVSQYYNYLSQLPQLGGPGVKGAVKKGSGAGNKRPPENIKVSSEPSNKKTVQSKEETKNIGNNIGSSPRKGTVGDKCAICLNKVYLLERHIEGGKLYHRSCFRHSDLSPTNKVYTKSPFMSPSLHNEKATLDNRSFKGSPAKSKNDPTIPLSHSSNDQVRESENSILTNVKSGLKKVDGTASKHSIVNGRDREEEVKKAKVQPKALFGKKENTKLSEQRMEENILPLPLSGKEARQLEKRKQVILSCESATPVSRNVKRVMPLAFQNKETTSSSGSSNSSQSSNSANEKTTISIHSKETPPNIVQNIQQKFSGQPAAVKLSDSASHQPVSKARLPGSKIASSPFINNARVDDTPLRKHSNQKIENTVPKAAPRKSLAMKTDNNTSTDSKLHLPHSQLLTPESPSSENASTPRSSSSPPALPLTPAPSLSKSKPPPLPSSLPPVIPTSLSQSSLPYHTVSTSANVSTILSEHSLQKKDKKDSTHSLDHHSSSSLASVSSSSLASVQSSSSSKYITASSNTPISVDSSSSSKVPSSSLVKESKDKDKVLSGLLTSLAGVRDRSASTPNPRFDQSQLTRQRDISANNLRTHTDSVSADNRKYSEPSAKLPFGNISTPKSTYAPDPPNRGISEPAVKFPFGNISAVKQTSHKSEAQKDLSKTSLSSGNSDISASAVSSSSSRKPDGKDSNEAISVLNSLKSTTAANAKHAAANDSKQEYLIRKPVKVESGINVKEKNKLNISDRAGQSHVTKKITGLKDSSSNETFKDVQLKPVRSKETPQTKVEPKTVTPPGNKGLSAVSENKPTPSNVQNETKSISSVTSTNDDIPQWKKDIEERKKKLQESIAQSEAYTKLNDKHSAVPKSNPELDVKSDIAENSQKTDKSKQKDTQKPKPAIDQNKLSWQLEAERRMATFAEFDSEDENKSLEIDFNEDRKVEDKLNQMKNKTKHKVKLKDSDVVSKDTKLKAIDITVDDKKGVRHDTSLTKGKELSKTVSLKDSNNSNINVSSEKEGKDQLSSTSDRLNLDIKPNTSLNKDEFKQPSTATKKKVSLMKDEKNIILPSPTTPALPEKKKIAVTGLFNFDDNSDMESSLTRSVEQMNIQDVPLATPERPPRTKSQRKKEESPRQISAIELQQQLLEIDSRLTDLELRGRDLEDSIRNASFQEGSEDIDGEENDDDRLMVEWFQLVCDKNDLVRMEADLVYISREQELEDDQEHIESQLQYLMTKDELSKTPQEKEEETYLLQRKLDIVNARSSIVDSMDEDRLRYEEEDKGIEFVLKSKGLWKDDGSLLAEKGKKVANSKFYT